MFDTTKKNGHDIFLTGEIAFFSKTSVFNNPLGVTEISLNLNIKGQKFTWSPTNCPLRIVKFDKRKRIRHCFFFIGNIAFFSETCVFSNILGVAEMVL